jgi:hypothetical protein
MVNPKDGQVLNIFRCRCEKLTATNGDAAEGRRDHTIMPAAR